mmetsp:Transcript_25614/g.52143  ORF Transcript_25614/g.52143 Transcript_25614/m.52143 type:complete len:211 (-) Transcript_25614:648-1280(-)
MHKTTWSTLKNRGFLLLFIGYLECAYAGYCVQPPRNALAFCSFINYKVYVIQENVPESYWFELDRRAEVLTEDWDANEDCDVQFNWCKNYACGLILPRCNTFGDAPLKVCRQTCIDCLSTCSPDRPILPPSLFYGGDSQTWEDQYLEVEYDAFLKSYRCEANHRLEDGVKVGLFWYGPDCTSSASHTAWFSLTLIALPILGLISVGRILW